MPPTQVVATLIQRTISIINLFIVWQNCFRPVMAFRGRKGVGVVMRAIWGSLNRGIKPGRGEMNETTIKGDTGQS